jgi:antitoxin component HigA of HigAB toxin-antitoxin module
MSKKGGKPMAALKEPAGDKSGRELRAEMVLARVTVNQVTKHTGYSQSFVSQVLNDKVALTMKAQQKIEQAIKELSE